MESTQYNEVPTSLSYNDSKIIVEDKINNIEAKETVVSSHIMENSVDGIKGGVEKIEKSSVANIQYVVYTKRFGHLIVTKIFLTTLPAHLFS